ncbi:uncharacterized protein [Acropora muricata]|uniref:uncharacterized protein n=1 Tax=Acropora muricata TaxID=159855 RepID=UPI0034E5EE81
MHFGRVSYLSGMAESSSSSDSERHGSPPAARTGPKCSRTFVWLRELPKAIPRGRPWDELNREGRVKEIEFGKKFTERHMRDKIKENFPELAEADFTRIRLYKSGSRGSLLKKVAKNFPDATQLLQKFKGGTSKRVYIILKNDNENGERSNSENQAARASAIHRRSNAVVPRDTAATRQYLTALSQSTSTQQTDSDSNTPNMEDDANLLQSPFEDVIDVDLTQDLDLSQSLHAEVIDVDQSHVQQGYKSSATATGTRAVSSHTEGILGTPFYSEGTKVGTVKENLSPHGLGDSSNLPSRTNEVIRLEKGLLAACKGEDTFLPCFLIDSFHELCWQAREVNKPMGIILLNPEKENMATREGIVRALRWLNSQNQPWLFWIAETSSVNGRSVCSMFSVRSTADSMLFLLPSTTWKPTLVQQLHDNNLTEVDVVDRLSEILEKTCDALKVLSAQREQLDKFRADREEQDHNFRQAQLEDQTCESDSRKSERQDNEKKARETRLSDEPEDGITIRIRGSTGTLSRKFKRGAHFQEVYDWAGTIESLPHYFTLHRGNEIVSHPEKLKQDETLNLTEREETEMETYFHSSEVRKST